MSSKHSRSPSPHERERKKRRTERPAGIAEIKEEDYFIKMYEFQSWLVDERGKPFDQLSGERARHYFRKFIKRWNNGELSDALYSGVSAPAPSAHTAYKWSFAKANPKGVISHSRDSKVQKVSGPTLPSASEVQLAKEYAEETRAFSQQSARKHDREAQKDRIDEQLGPKESGREGKLDKQKAQRESNKEAQNAKDDGGIEYSESYLMGGGDSFRAAIAKRDAGRRRFEEKKRQEQESKAQSSRERTVGMREKEKATMDMFKAMAKERFG